MKKIIFLFLLFFAATAVSEKGWGFLDATGAPLSDLQFDYAYTFNEGYAVVYFGRLDRYGFPGDGKFGIVDTVMNFVIEPVWDKINPVSDGMAAVRKDGKWGFINMETKGLVIPCIYDYIDDFIDGYAAAFTGTLDHTQPDTGVFSFIDKEGKAIAESSNWKYCFIYKNGIGTIQTTDGKNQLISLSTNQIFNYELRSRVTNDLICVMDKGKYGYINLDGTVAIPLIFDDAYPFYDGVAVVNKNKVIDTAGNTVVDLPYDYVDSFIDGFAVAYKGQLAQSGYPDSTGQYCLIDLEGNIIIDWMQCKSMDYYGGKFVCIVKDENYNDFTFYNTDGMLLHNYPITNCSISINSSNNNAVYVKTESGWGAIDSEGNIIVPFEWDDVLSHDGEYFTVYRWQPKTNIRNVSWGMSVEEVAQLEGGEYSTSGNEITFIKGDCYIRYGFEDNRLCSGTIVYFEPDGDSALNRYEEIKAELAEKYREPLSPESEEWSSEDAKSNLSRGAAIDQGALQYSIYYGSTDEIILAGIKTSDDLIGVYLYAYPYEAR